jgi:hypothetical protein
VTDADKKTALRRYLRRKYGNDLPGLRAVCDDLALKGMEPVTINSLSSDGGSSAGQITTDPLLFLAAAEEVLRELDPNSEQELGETDSAIVRFS